MRFDWNSTKAEANAAIFRSRDSQAVTTTGLTVAAHRLMTQLPRLITNEETWIRAGEMRRKLVEKKSKARGMDCLIAQNCIDHDVSLITLDYDFCHFTAFGLTLIPKR
jgi:predicted nucleic acid-binding protein